MKTQSELALDLAKEIKKNYTESNCLDDLGLAIRLTNAGYRLDPYPNGKSKDELIARIETVEAERDKTRYLLRREHDFTICKGNLPLLAGYRKRHEELDPDCPTCAFLAETSTVKQLPELDDGTTHEEV